MITKNLDKIKYIIKQIKPNINDLDINFESDIINDFNFESIELMQLLIDIEINFSIKLPEDKLYFNNIKSIEYLIKIIEEEQTKNE